MDTVMDPELLQRFADGELEPEEAARVVLHLAENPRDQAYLDRLVELGAVLTAAYDAPLREPVPPAIERAIFARTGLSRAARAVRLLRRRGPLAGLAIAASLALALGVTLWPEPVPQDLLAGPIPTRSALHAGLDTSPSGAERLLETGERILIIGTFLDASGRACREFELLGASGQDHALALACRDGMGWSMQVAVSEPVVASAEPADGYAPASGASIAALTEVLDAIGAGPVLGPEDEGALMARDWQL